MTQSKVKIRIDLRNRKAYCTRNTSIKYACKLIQDELKRVGGLKGGWQLSTLNGYKPYAYLPSSLDTREWTEADDTEFEFQIQNPFASPGTWI